MEEKKNLEVVSGDGSNLDISPVYDHLNSSKPTPSNNKPTNIVIPKETIPTSKEKDDNEDNDTCDNDKK